MSLPKIPNTVLDADRLGRREAGIGKWIGGAPWGRKGILGSNNPSKPLLVKRVNVKIDSSHSEPNSGKSNPKRKSLGVGVVPSTSSLIKALRGIQ